MFCKNFKTLRLSYRVINIAETLNLIKTFLKALEILIYSTSGILMIYMYL
jgi:hypothetical protein